MKTTFLTDHKVLLAGAILLLGLITGFVFWISPPAFLAVFIFSIDLAACWMMYHRPVLVVFFLVAYLPFEEIILKYAPIPDRIYVYSRFFGEFLIYTTFFLLLIRKLFGQEKLRRTPVDGYLAAFLLIVAISLLVNRPPLVGGLVNLRALLRYTVLYYLVVNLELEEDQVRKIIHMILVIGIFQLLIGAMQLAMGAKINSILLPRATDIELGGYSRGFILLIRGREVGSIFGTLGDTVFFALYMAIVLGVYLGQIEKLRLKEVVFISLIFIGINYSYTRALVLGFFLVLFIFYRIRYGRSRAAAIFLLSLLGLSSLILLINSSYIQREFISPLKQKQTIFQNLSGIFTIKYFEIAQFQRLGTLTGIPPIVLSDSPLLGYGPDEITTIERLNANLPKFNLPLFKRDSFTTKGFEDVYWVALLAYYGILGLGLIVLIFHRFYVSFLYIYKRTQSQLTSNMAITAACLVGLGAFLLFFYQVLEFRSFSFYFWLIPAMVYNLYSKEVRSLENSQKTI